MLSHQDLLKAGEGKELESAMTFSAITQGWQRLPGGKQIELQVFHSILGLELAVPNLDECLIA